MAIDPTPLRAMSGPEDKRLHRTGAGLVAACILVAIGLSGCALGDNNFHTVAPGQVYRSAQMNGGELARCIKKYKIQSILNLRGENPNAGWYQTEIKTAARLNIVHYDRDLDPGTQLTVEQMDDLVALLRQAPKPVLVHCHGGADRAGLVSALYCFAIEGKTANRADRQLTIWYGHVPFVQPKVIAMDESFWHYVSNQVSSVKSVQNASAIAAIK